MKTWKFVSLMALAGLAFVLLMFAVRQNHISKCDVCRDKAHCEKCAKLSYDEKGKFDQSHGCDWFWCPHYNGR